MAFDGSDLYQMASRLAMPDLQRAARAAGVMSIFEVTVYYAARRIRHSVARAIEYQTGKAQLEIAFEGVNVGKPMVLGLDRPNLEALNAALLAVNFGRLGDQADLTYADDPLWLIQQAAGAHIHGITVAPERPELPYSAIVNAIDAWLPEAIRQVPLRS